MFEWRVISEYPRYSVSDRGEVRNDETKRILKPSSVGNGYQHVTLSNENGRRQKTVHRLVAKEFIENPRGCDTVNHIDGNPSNNCVENLEWCTQSENMKHAYRIGLQKPNWDQVEYSLARSHEAHKRPVRNIETGACYPSIKECAEAEGIGSSGVSYHVTGNAKKCRFEYAD